MEAHSEIMRMNFDRLCREECPYEEYKEKYNIRPRCKECLEFVGLSYPGKCPCVALGTEEAIKRAKNRLEELGK